MKQTTDTVPTAERGGRRFRNDLILIGALLIVTVTIGLCCFFLRPDGDTVTVEVDGQLIGTYELSVDRTVEIRTGGDQAEINVLVISGGEAFVESATCPDGICSSHRPISREGESIVCLPHRVVITVRRSGGEAPDVVA